MTNIPCFLHSLSCSDSGVCVWGCNPHCHFILLLRSLSFDHSVLLDFLISSETCFLEYCVRYLKLLREDRTAFSSSCRHIEDCAGAPSVQAPSAVSETLDVVPRTRSSADVPRLVDYGSSDESEEAEERVSDRDSGNTEADSGKVQTEHASDSLLGKVFVCLMDLRSAVTRIHNRGLFPYNPTSLLKLLNSIDPQRDTLR